MLLLVYGRRDWSRNNQSLPRIPEPILIPQEIDITGTSGEASVVIVGGVQQPAKTKADFVPRISDETVPGEYWNHWGEPPTEEDFPPQWLNFRRLRLGNTTGRW